MSALEWAKREVKYAKLYEKKTLAGGQPKDPYENCLFDYEDACRISALKAFKSLIKDSHSGASIAHTKKILNRLIDGKPLSPIEDADDMWIGESPLPMVFIYNKTMIDEADVPTTWEGLCNENLKGKIAYASPAKSGSAYTQLCTMLFSQPTVDEGWALVEKFIANLDGKIQDSSGNCHKLVASGEYALGVTIEKSAVLYADNPDIGFVYPEKDSAVPDGVALIKNCPNEENAKLFIDFVTGLECQTAQNQDWKRRPVRSDLSPVGLCELSEIDLGDYDFAYAATEKEAIVEKWNDLTVG